MMDDVRVFYIKEKYGLKALDVVIKYTHFAITLFRIIRKKNIQLIHCHDVQLTALVTALLIRITKIPSVIKYAADAVWQISNRNKLVVNSYEDIFDLNFKTKILKNIEKFILNSFDAIWATSQFQKKSLTKFMKINNDKIVTFPNYVDISKYRQNFRTFEKDKAVILSVSRFAPWKRLDNTLEIFSNIAKENKNVILRLVGEVNSSLEKEIKELSLEDNIEVFGEVSPTTIHKHFKESDIFLSSAIYEPFGIVFVEAMAAGLPIIATNVGGIPEIVENGRVGFLLDPGDIEGATEKLKELINNVEQRKKFSLAGQRCAEKYNITKYRDDFNRLHNTAIENNKEMKK